MARKSLVLMLGIAIILVLTSGCISQGQQKTEIKNTSVAQNLTPPVVETAPKIPEEINGYKLNKNLWTGTFEKAKLKLEVGERPPPGYVESSAGFIKVNEGIDPGLISYMQRNKDKDKIHVFILLTELGLLYKGELEALKEFGAENFVILGYYGRVTVPNSAEMLEKIVSHPKVFWVGEIKPVDKGLYREHDIPNYSINPDGTVNIWITFHENIAVEDAENLLRSYGRDVEQKSIYMWTVTLPKDKISELAKEDIVFYIEE